MGLRLVLDEDTERDLAQKLRHAGHDVERVVEVEDLGAGAADKGIRTYARRTDRIIVTHDDDHVAAPSDERQGLLARSFHLVHDDATVEERNRIEVAGGSTETLDRTDVYGVERNERWRAHGTSLDVDETYSTTAIFEISTETDTEQVSVVFEPTSDLEDHFADDAIRWD